ncbi:hypothetical protein Hanom_Chr16g01438391 [Helianthus anomalus]
MNEQSLLLGNYVYRCRVWAYISNYVYRMFCTFVFLGVMYGRRYVTMCIGCFVLLYLFCSTMHYFATHTTLVASYTHTHTSCSIYFFPGCFGAECLSRSRLSIPRGKGKVCLHPTLPRPYK